MKILIDNGHGEETPGKCSPDGRLREWELTRRIAQGLSRRLTLMGHDAILLTPERWDVKLSERVRRANAWVRRLGKSEVVVVSIHIDAAAGPGWHPKASGFSSRVGLNASAASKRLGRMLWEEADKRGLRGNRCVPADKVWPQNLAICRDTLCPAVLTESLFMTNPAEVDYLMSDEGLATIIDLHAAAIDRYTKEQ